MQRDDFLKLKENENQLLYNETSVSPLNIGEKSKPHNRFEANVRGAKIDFH